MIFPNFLKKGDLIGVTAPSDGASKDEDFYRLDRAILKMNEAGFDVVITDNCKTSLNGRSSDSKERGKQLEELYLNDNVKAIICFSGGEFLLEMLSYVNFDIIKKHPKWIQGYSDPTGLLFTITTNLDIATIYGNNFKTFAMSKWHQSIIDNLNFLTGNIYVQNSFKMYENECLSNVVDGSYNLDSFVKWENITGDEEIEITGRLIGGCLDVLLNLVGTKYDNTVNFIEKYKEDGIIWYFDNCDLSSEEIIRAFWQLKESGWLKYVNGIVFGRSATEDGYYMSFKEAVYESLNYLNVPIIVNADLGHKAPRMTLINGSIATFKSKDGKGSLTQKII